MIDEVSLKEIPFVDTFNDPWDAIGGGPDIFFRFVDINAHVYHISNTTVYHISNTTQDVVQDDLPLYIEIENFEIKDEERELYIYVYDEDLVDDDFMGWVGPFTIEEAREDDFNDVIELINHTWTIELSIHIDWE